MNKIWANRLIAGDKQWSDLPAYRRAGVKDELAARVVSGLIAEEQYKAITGETYPGE